MKTKISLTAVVAFALLLTGCTSINSGNFAKRNMSLPYDKGNAVTTATTTDIDANGKETTHIEKVEQTMPAVNKDITFRQLDRARDAFVAQASNKSSSGGFWSSPQPYYYGGGSGFYYGGNYPNCGPDNMSPHLGGGGVALGGYITSGPGGGNGNMSPNLGGVHTGIGGTVISGPGGGNGNMSPNLGGVHTGVGGTVISGGHWW